MSLNSKLKICSLKILLLSVDIKLKCNFLCCNVRDGTMESLNNKHKCKTQFIAQKCRKQIENNEAIRIFNTRRSFLMIKFLILHAKVHWN